MKTENKNFSTIDSLKKEIFTVPHLLTVLFYILFVNWNEKVLVILMATGFSAMEFLFTGGHTTIQQWFTNLAGLPLCLLWPIKYITNYFSTQAIEEVVNFNGYTWLVSIALFPYLIWMIEIVEGVWLEFWNDGNNPAWYYNTSDARFGGKIRIDYFFHWIGLGIFYHLCFYLIQ